MSKSYKKWSKQEKIKILHAAEQEGVVSACRKHEVSTATFYNWKKIYDQHGEEGFKGDKSSSDQLYKKLEEENRRLKKLLVDKDLALEVQKEFLKKSLGQTIQADAAREDLVDRLSAEYKVSKQRVMRHVGLSSSSYYFKPTEGRKGRLPSTTTKHEKQGEIANKQVIEQVENVLSAPFQDYWGYHNITAELQEIGYLINHKKVYRLMKEAKLLRPSTRLRPKPSKGKYVQFRKIETKRPLEYVEMDIKCVWVPEKGKQAYLLSLLDVHTRKVLAYSFDWNMKQDKVIDLYAGLIDKGLLPEGTIIRSDNGSQFIAANVREYLKMVGLDQEFTHVATPEENGHVEAYHGILKKELFLRFEYYSFSQAKELIDEYVQYYNY